MTNSGGIASISIIVLISNLNCSFNLVNSMINGFVLVLALLFTKPIHCIRYFAQNLVKWMWPPLLSRRLLSWLFTMPSARAIVIVVLITAPFSRRAVLYACTPVHDNPASILVKVGEPSFSVVILRHPRLPLSSSCDLVRLCTYFSMSECLLLF